MTTTICRICSSPADYEVFAKIPAYLHATSNEFLNWQKPINVLLEEVTGLKISREDGLPHCICALCISYLKHAVTFRDQTINNALSLKAVQLLRQQTQKQNATDKRKRDMEKDSLLITAQDLHYTDEHQTDTNLLINNGQQEQDKVRKKLLNNNFQNTATTQQNMEQQMRYLNLLFDKDTNAGLRPKHRNVVALGGAYELTASSGGDPYAGEDFQTATSSDDNDNAASAAATGTTTTTTQKHNIFSYKEKNFEEDDIMDLDELRNAITINIPESCKERKCRACFRRFMFEDSYKEHMDTCIEYKFLTYIEEVNRLLDIRRNKAISPHEFIRRMIFCLRKTCEWLKANCGDMLLPDLMQNGDAASKERAESDNKSSATSSGENKNESLITTTAKANEKLAKLCDASRRNTNEPTDKDKTLENVLLATPKKLERDLNLETNLCSIFKTPKPPLQSGTTTPITVSNNILYEIERSQSRNSNKQQIEQQQPENVLELALNNMQLKKPIAVLATNTNTTTTTITNSTLTSDSNNINNNTSSNSKSNAAERLTFLEKLQKAACLTPPAQQQVYAGTPLIAVRKDLLLPAQTQPNKEPLTLTTPTMTNLSFSARCNPCNLLFETLASLEVHNAMHHNNLQQQKQTTPIADADEDDDEERRRIIALFEEDSMDED